MLVFWHFAKFKKPSNTDTKKFIKNLYTHTSFARVFHPNSFVNQHHLSARERYSSFSSDPCQRVLPGSFSRILSIRFVRGKFKNLNPPPKQRQPSWWIHSILIMSSASTLESTIYVRDDDEEDTNFNGKIELIFGPMFSGKSTELHRRIRRHKIAGRSVLLIKYKDDTRYAHICGSNANVTHDHQTLPAHSAKELMGNMDNIAHNYDVIGIDEGQFFGDVVAFCDRWANKGKVVICAALDGTYEREMFNDILKLVPMAESVDKLTSVCAMCSKDASFTLRCFDSSKNSSREKEEEDGPVELIGGAEMYKAACRKCYFAAMKGRRGDKRESVGEMATTEMTKTAKKKATTPLATRPVIGSPTNAKRVAEALAETVDSLSLQTPPLNAMTRSKATPTKYNEDVGDAFTFATPSGGNALLDDIGFATGKLGEQVKKAKKTATKKSRGFGGPGRSPLTDFMNTSRSPITTLR